MFEKEAEEYREKGKSEGYYLVSQEMEQEELDYIIDESFKDGAELGYNKANEWHWIKDGDFPEEEKEYLIYTKKKKLEIRKIHISGDGKNYLTDVFLMRDLESVIAWKEIVPPELEESEL